MAFVLNPFTSILDYTNAVTAPGGADGQIQFNSSGSFGGDSAFTWDNTNKLLSVLSSYGSSGLVPLTIRNTSAGANTNTLIVNWSMNNSASVVKQFFQIKVASENHISGAERSKIDFGVMYAGSFVVPFSIRSLSQRVTITDSWKLYFEGTVNSNTMSWASATQELTNSGQFLASTGITIDQPYSRSFAAGSVSSPLFVQYNTDIWASDVTILSFGSDPTTFNTGLPARFFYQASSSTLFFDYGNTSSLLTVSLNYLNANKSILAFGSAGAPSYTFKTATNSGMYMTSADNTLRFSTNSTQALLLDSTQRLLCGNSSFSSGTDRAEIYNNKTTASTINSNALAVFYAYNPSANETSFTNRGLIVSGDKSGTSNIADIRGFQAQATNTGTGTITDLCAGTYFVSNTAATTITRAQNCYVFSPTASSGTITACYGVRILGQKVTNVTTGYGITSEGASDMNGFAGRMTLGLLSASSSVGLWMRPLATTERAFLIQALASQSSNIVEYVDWSSNLMHAIGPRGEVTISPMNSTSGSPFILKITGSAHTGLTAATESPDLDFNLSRSVQFSTGAITAQRVFKIQPPTYTFVAASTVSDAATFYVSDAPIAGTNATFTRKMSAWFDAGNVRIDDDLNVGLLGANPTAKVHITGSTTSKAPLRIESGTAPTSPNDGEVWYDSTQKCLIERVDGINQYQTNLVYSSSGSTSFSNSTTEVSLIPSGIGTLTLPANFFVAGKRVRISASGRNQRANAAHTLQVKLKLGTTIILDTGAQATPASFLVDRPWKFNVELICTFAGASGNILASSMFEYTTDNIGLSMYAFMTGGSGITVDTTASKTIDLTFQFNTASLNNLVATDNFQVEVLA